MFIPSVAQAVRAPMVAALEYFLQRHRYCRFWTFTSGPRCATAELNGRIATQHRRLAVHAADGASALNDASALESPWAALIIAITPILVAAIKAIAPRIPTWLVPISASLIGCVLAFAGSYFAGVDVNWWQGLLLGLGGVGLREILNQVAKPHKTVEQNDLQPSYGEGEGDT